VLSEKIAVIGAGKIGSAIARGILKAGLVGKEAVVASDVSEALRRAISRDLGIKATAANLEACDFADIVILAVKPQTIAPVAQ
jgi:pyrroline-5-carboxylate reductase